MKIDISEGQYIYIYNERKEKGSTLDVGWLVILLICLRPGREFFIDIESHQLKVKYH